MTPSPFVSPPLPTVIGQEQRHLVELARELTARNCAGMIDADNLIGPYPWLEAISRVTHNRAGVIVLAGHYVLTEELVDLGPTQQPANAAQALELILLAHSDAPRGRIHINGHGYRVTPGEPNGQSR